MVVLVAEDGMAALAHIQIAVVMMIEEEVAAQVISILPLLLLTILLDVYSTPLII